MGQGAPTEHDDLIVPSTLTIAVQLQWLARALFAAYLFSVVADALPLRVGDLNWRLNLVNTVVDNATIPLIGLGIAHLAAYLDPASSEAQAMWRRVASLAVLASVGFLLIAPLQISTSVSLYAELSATRFQQVDRADQGLMQLAAAVRRSTTVDQLESTLLSLQGSALSQNDRRQPLDSLKQLLLNRINEARKVLTVRRREQAKATPLDPTLLVRRSLRVVLTSLVFGLAFAAGAQLPSSPFTLLETWGNRALELQAWLTRGRSQRSDRQQQKQKNQAKEEQQRLAALQAQRQQRPPEPSRPQAAEPEPWDQSPPLSDLDFFDMIMVDDPVEPPAPSPQAEMPMPQPTSQPDSPLGPPGPSAPPSARG